MASSGILLREEDARSTNRTRPTSRIASDELLMTRRLPGRAAQEIESRQEPMPPRGACPIFDPEVESEEREQESLGGQTELAQGRGEAEAVDEPEDKADEPARATTGPHEDVLGGDEGDGQRR